MQVQEPLQAVQEDRQAVQVAQGLEDLVEEVEVHNLQFQDLLVVLVKFHIDF
jgi:hypothetical protein